MTALANGIRRNYSNESSRGDYADRTETLLHAAVSFIDVRGKELQRRPLERAGRAPPSLVYYGGRLLRLGQR
jgi:hypothetical protein